MHQTSYTEDKPYSASGRFGRMSYLAWLFVSSIITMIILIAGMMLFGGMGALNDPAAFSTPLLIIFILIYIAFIYFSFIFLIRRLHDLNQSGWLSLIMLIPFVNLIFALYVVFAKGTEGINKYGAPRVTPGWEKVMAWVYILLIPITGVLAALAIPTYQQYIERAQMQTIEQQQNLEYQQHQQPE